jgi:hypothetical protein
MPPLFDIDCQRCQHRWETVTQYNLPAPECPKCGSNFTRTLMPLMKHHKAKDPYDALRSGSPGKPIKSFAHDRRLKGKDTT